MGEFLNPTEETELRFREARDRWKAATPGPWKMDTHNGYISLLSRLEKTPYTVGPFFMDGVEHHFPLSETRTQIAEFKDTSYLDPRDKQFILHSWEDMGFLIDRVASLEETLRFVNDLRISETDKLRDHNHRLFQDNKTLTEQIRFDAHWIHRVLTLEEENKELRARLGE